MRVLFINQADEEILNETINRVSVDNSTNNIDELKFNSCDAPLKNLRFEYFPICYLILV